MAQTAFVQYQNNAFASTAQTLAASWPVPKKGNGTVSAIVNGQPQQCIVTKGRGKAPAGSVLPCYVYVTVDNTLYFVATHSIGLVGNGVQVWVGAPAQAQIDQAAQAALAAQAAQPAAALAAAVQQAQQAPAAPATAKAQAKAQAARKGARSKQTQTA